MNMKINTSNLYKKDINDLHLEMIRILSYTSADIYTYICI